MLTFAAFPPFIFPGSKMKLFDYIPLALRTAKPLENRVLIMQHAAMGIASDLGELITIIKAVTIYNKPLDIKNAIEELGDVLWFLVYAAEFFRVNLYFDNLDDVDRASDLAECALVLASKSGTFNQMILATCDGVSYSNETWGEKLRELFWMLEQTAAYMGLSLMGEAAPANIVKLSLRYPDKYSDELAQKRLDKPATA